MAEATAYIALGSNLGDREAQLETALAALRASAGIRVTAVSELYETEPLGPPPQGPYLNGAAELVTSLEPRRLLDRLLAIEAAAGRRRGAVRNAARPLDLDLLFFGAQRIDEPGLRVPHPRLHERAFVLEPLCEIAARLVHPVLGETIEELARCVRNPAAVRRRQPHPGRGEGGS